MNSGIAVFRAAAVAALCIVALNGEITVSSDFEAGSIGECKTISENHLECAVEGETDHDGRNRQASWYFFKLDGVAGREITIDLVALEGEYNYKPHKGSINGYTPPHISNDGKAWRRIESENLDYDPEQPRLRLRFQAETDSVWLAHVQPYTTRDLASLLKLADASPYAQTEVIGKSVEGRDLLLLTITDPKTPDERKNVVWLMFRQHAWETGSSWVAHGLVQHLLSRRRDTAALRRKTVYKILPMCDPDGVVRGGVRFNANGYDLNRNWDAVDPKLMPEIAAQRQAVLSWVDAGNPIDLFLTVHNTETAEYLDGPPPEAIGRHHETTNRLFNFLRSATSFAATREPRMGQTSTTPGRPGRMTVVQGLFKDRGIPAMLMELMIAKQLKLGHPPTAGDRLRFGANLAIATSNSAPRPTTRVGVPDQ